MARIPVKQHPRRVVRTIPLTPSQCKELAGFFGDGRWVLMLPRVEDGYARVIIYGRQAREALRKVDDEMRRAMLVDAGEEQKKLDFR